MVCLPHQKNLGCYMAKLRTPVTSRDHIQGPEDAPLTLVEYGDYECPSCGSAYPIVKRVQEKFGKRLRFVFRNFPLSEIHPQAESAAETAEFAAAQGKFREMHDLLFENQEQLSEAFYSELAEELGLSPTAFRQALEVGKYKSCSRRLQQWRPQRSQRHPDVLHQRDASRWTL
jgi:protein-disulfide isomerase